MKRTYFSGILLFAAISAQASAPSVLDSTSIALELNQTLTGDLIRWKVGDTMTYDMGADGMGKLGSVVMAATKDEGTAIWLTTNVDLSFQKDKIETLYNRADGKVLKMIHNGKEEAVPDDQPEIISTDAATITVPAGKFDTTHVVAKTKKVSHVELWVNPMATPLTGMIKQYADMGMAKVTLELASFKRAALETETSTGLVIHAAELGIGKFHRMDNAVHPYANDNAWKAYVLANEAKLESPIVVENADHSVTVYFSSLEELLTTVVSLSKSHGQKVSVININAHGLPGGMWFPKDAAQRDSDECADWRQAASAEDQANYDQYYSAIPKEDILMMRRLSEYKGGHFSCVTGEGEFAEVTAKVQGLKDAMAADAQVHMLSCIVGLGARGEAFTTSLAPLFLSTEAGRIETSMNFGLGDWSMPEGMGFWDYQNDAQLDKDNSVYPVERRDRTMMQKGAIRVATLGAHGLMNDVDFMFLNTDTRGFAKAEPKKVSAESVDAVPALTDSVAIPGTPFRVRLLK